MTENRIAFTVYVEGKPYDVWDLQKEHEGWNDTIKSWWIYYSDRLPDGICPPEDSEYFLPFQKSINRRLWDIKVTQRNYTKDKWDETNFRNSTYVEMFCNSRLVYAFTTSGTNEGLNYAFAKIQVLQIQMGEHPFNFFESEKEQGRKIFWYGLPATVIVRQNSPWEIMIAPDYSGELTEDAWWKELRRRESKIGNVDPEDIEMYEDEFSETRASGYINWGDALSDQHIDWFRK